MEHSLENNNKNITYFLVVCSFRLIDLIFGIDIIEIHVLILNGSTIEPYGSKVNVHIYDLFICLKIHMINLV